MNLTTSKKVLVALEESLKFVEEQREAGLDVDYEFDLISEAIAAMHRRVYWQTEVFNCNFN